MGWIWKIEPANYEFISYVQSHVTTLITHFIRDTSWGCPCSKDIRTSSGHSLEVCAVRESNMIHTKQMSNKEILAYNLIIINQTTKFYCCNFSWKIFTKRLFNYKIIYLFNCNKNFILVNSNNWNMVFRNGLTIFIFFSNNFLINLL